MDILSIRASRASLFFCNENLDDTSGPHFWTVVRPAQALNLSGKDMCLKNSVSGFVISMFICVSLENSATAEEEVPIYNFGGGYFSVTSAQDSFVYGPEEQGTCDFGSFTSQCRVFRGRMVRNFRGITFHPDGDSEGPSLLQITISFDSPADLSPVDFFDIDYDHTELETPLAGIVMKLENGKRINFFNGLSNGFGVRNLIGRHQTKIPVYGLEDPNNMLFAQQMKGVTEVTILFDVYGDSTVLAKSLGSWILNKKPMGLKSWVEMDSGNKMLVIESDRPIGPDEVYRLELSSDLKRWQMNSQPIRGTGEKVLIKKRIPKAPWYRLSFFNYVDVDS